MAENSFRQIEILEKENKKYETFFEKNRKPYRPIRNLMTIPGISIIRANIIAAVVCSITNNGKVHRKFSVIIIRNARTDLDTTTGDASLRSRLNPRNWVKEKYYPKRSAILQKKY